MSIAASVFLTIRAMIWRSSCLLILLAYASSFVMLPLPLTAKPVPSREEQAGSRGEGTHSCNCACTTRGDGICRCISCGETEVCPFNLAPRDEQVVFLSPVRDATLPNPTALAPVLWSRSALCQLPCFVVSPVLGIPTPPPKS